MLDSKRLVVLVIFFYFILVRGIKEEKDIFGLLLCDD